MKQKPLKVAIVGGRCSTWNQVLTRGKGWEVWALNGIRAGMAGNAPWSRCFNLHRYTHLRRDWHNGVYDEAKWANANPQIPFYVCDRWPKALLPNQVMFPLKALEALPRGGEYHAGSFDMMVAYALLLGAKEIALHGVGLNMESGEPISGRACLEYWCGVAEGRGVKVTATKDCDMFLQYHIVKSRSIYGFDDIQIIEDRT